MNINLGRGSLAVMLCLVTRSIEPGVYKADWDLRGSMPAEHNASYHKSDCSAAAIVRLSSAGQHSLSLYSKARGTEPWTNLMLRILMNTACMLIRTSSIALLAHSVWVCWSGWWEIIWFLVSLSIQRLMLMNLCFANIINRGFLYHISMQSSNHDLIGTRLSKLAECTMHHHGAWHAQIMWTSACQPEANLTVYNAHSS